MSEAVLQYLEEIRDLPCAPLVRLVVEQVCALDAHVEAEVGAYGLQLRCGGRSLCELSVFGELFIARVGSEQAVEYRVRRHEVAFEVLDRILRELESHAAAG